MLDHATARHTAVGELEGMVRLVEDLVPADWRRATRCPGWTVRDVCAHTAVAAAQHAEAFRRATTGALEPPEWPGAPQLPPAEVVDLLHAGRHALDAALEALPADVLEGTTPMPFGVVPTAVAMHIAVFEYAFHLDDTRTALGQLSTLPPEVAATFIPFFPRLAGMLSRRAQPGEMTHAYRLVAPSGTVTVPPAGDDTLPVCTITGPDDAIALLCMGRIGISDARLDVAESERTIASDLKRWFSGP